MDIDSIVESLFSWNIWRKDRLDNELAHSLQTVAAGTRSFWRKVKNTAKSNTEKVNNIGLALRLQRKSVPIFLSSICKRLNYYSLPWPKIIRSLVETNQIYNFG
jgi:hypothetical protein